jgi:hypothetical protein
MTYKEREISRDSLGKFLISLDSDEGIRIDNKSEHVFINKSSKRYCINTSNGNKEEFIYKYTVDEVIDFLGNYITKTTRIFSY